MVACLMFVFILSVRSVLAIELPKNHLQLNNTHINCYRSYNINVRPPSNRVLPVRDVTDTFDNIQLSRHHIIPRTTLREFYNTLLRQQDERHFRRFFEDVLIPAGTSTGLTLHTVENLNLIRNHDWIEEEEVLRVHILGNARQSNQVNLARELYIWLPFNIFLGPSPNHRDDDPGDGFEENAHVIVNRLRLEQLRQMHVDMAGYVAGTVADPANIIDQMIDLLRTTPLPYGFNPEHWRVHRYTGRYAIATQEIADNPSYRRVASNDYCRDGVFAFHRYDPAEFSRSRRQAEQKKCLVRDEGAVYDRYCVHSLDLLREMVREKILTLRNNEITFNNVDEGERKKTAAELEHRECHPALAAAGGAVTGAGSAFAACMLLGGAYIPFVGWAGCGFGSAVYGVGGLVVGSTISLAQCDF